MRFKLTPDSAASVASWRWTSGGIRTIVWKRQVLTTKNLRLKSKLQNQVYHLIFGYRIVVIDVELLEYIAAKVKTLFMQQALREGNKFASGDYAILINIKDIE
jgi:hypothetical protein